MKLDHPLSGQKIYQFDLDCKSFRLDLVVIAKAAIVKVPVIGLQKNDFGNKMEILIIVIAKDYVQAKVALFR